MKAGSIFRNFARFRGRAGRVEFWGLLAVAVAGALVLGPAARIAGADGARAVLVGVWILILLLPVLSATARRFHDYELSGWWMLLALVPGVGLAFVLWVAALRGTDGANRFGPEPGRSAEL